MKKKIFILRMTILPILFLLSVQVKSQEQVINDSHGSMLKSKLSVDDFSYQKPWWSQEQHSTFKFSYKVRSKFLVELQGVLDSYLMADVFKTSMTTKWYVADKFYIFSGVELELERDKIYQNSPPPQLKLKNGFGYDIQENFMLEFVHDLHFDKSVIGTYGTPSMFTLKSKYKF